MSRRAPTSRSAFRRRSPALRRPTANRRKIAAEMAIEDINAAGGVLGQKLQLVTYDDQAKSDQAIFTANKLIGEDGVKFVVNGSYSASGRAAAPVFQKAGVVIISAYGVHPDITRAGDYMFRLVHLGPPQGARRRCSSARSSSSRRSPPSPWTTTTARPPWMASWRRAQSTASRWSTNTATRCKDRQFGSIVASVKRDNPDARLRHRLFLHRRSAGCPAARRRRHGADHRLAGFRLREVHRDRRPRGEGHLHHRQLRSRPQGRPALQKFFAEFQKRAGYRAGGRGRDHLFGGEADGGRHQARRQR